VEAIFLGVYLYGWERVRPRAHFLAGIMVALSGVLSGVFVVIANAWMNTPSGFRMAEGRAVDVSPWGALNNAAAPSEILHMTLAAYVSIGFAVAGIHAFLLLRDRTQVMHRRALVIALSVGGVAAVLQPLSGDVSARHVAEHQPAKLAAMEGLFRTQRAAPLHAFGWPDEEARETRFAIEIPYGLSLLAFHDPHAEVKGLDAIPRDEWPPVAVVHVAFQVMVGCGSVLALTAMIGAFLAWRRRAPADQPWYLKLLVACSPLGLVALEAGWTVTEVGRQPWIVHGVMRTADAVTPMPALAIPFTVFTLLYMVLGAVVVMLLKRQVFASARPLRPPGPVPVAETARP
jgi:cytochrome d ubiquinol oxidase subunit I